MNNAPLYLPEQMIEKNLNKLRPAAAYQFSGLKTPENLAAYGKNLPDPKAFNPCFIKTAPPVMKQFKPTKQAAQVSALPVYVPKDLPPFSQS